MNQNSLARVLCRSVCLVALLGANSLFLGACSANTEGSDATQGGSGDTGGSTGANSAGAWVGGSGSTTGAAGAGREEAVGGSSSAGSSAVTSGGVTGQGGSEAASCDAIALMRQTCAGMGCHELPQPAAMLDLVGDGVESRVVGVPSNSCADWALVTAGTPEMSLIYQKIVLDTPQCGLRMPLVAPLSELQIQCIKQWIVDLAGDDPPPQCETCDTTVCVDLQTDPLFCGDCSTSCDGQVCVSGSCQGCEGTDSACGGACVNTDTDSRHCGSCDNACGGGEGCVDGQCQCVASTAVSFATEVAPILEGGCADMGCHGGRRPQEGLSLLAADAYAALVGVNSVQCTPSMLLVDPGNSSGSYLMNKLLGQDMCSGTIMPKGAGELSAEEKDIIGQWICAGAPDN